MKPKIRLNIAVWIVVSLFVTMGTNAAQSTNSVSSGQQELAKGRADEKSVHIAAVQNQAAAIPDNMEAAAENDSLILYINSETAEIAVRDKKTNGVWYSNPPNRKEDAIATDHIKSKLGAQFEINYYDSKGKPLNYDSYNHSVLNKQFELENIDDGIKIVYTLGEVKKEIDEIPQFISEERFRTVILDRIEKAADKREVEKRFKYIEEEKKYERRDSTFNAIGLSKVTKIFEAIGYDEQERAVDKQAYSELDGPSAGFKIPLIYQLDGGELLASIPVADIEYPDTIRIHSISLLPYFGASDSEEKGYMFVPDGSGSLIYLNNGKTSAPPYVSSVYGSDSAIRQMTRSKVEEVTRLPVFGMKSNDKAFVAVIENGDAIAKIEADISGRVSSYNAVSSSYTISLTEEVTLTAGWRSNTVNQFQKDPYEGDIKVRYGFMQGELASYAGMATYYRDYLIETYGLSKLNDEEQLPFYLELVGGIPMKKFFLGIPYESYEPLTTFDEAEKILNELKNNSIHNINVRYTGWFNKGVSHKFPDSISVDKQLGGKKGLNELIQYTNDNHIMLFPDVSFLEVFKDKGGFNSSDDASRFITGKISRIYPYNTASYFQDSDKTPSYVLSPKRLPKVVGGFMKDYNKLDFTGLSLRDLANELNSDFNEKDVINREEAKHIVVNQLEQIHGSVNELLVEGGNAIAMPYAKHVINAPMTSSEYLITDESIPFYQMVFHGYVDYAGISLNLSENQDPTWNLLKALEVGSSLQYTWFYDDSSAVKGTDFSYLYSASFRDWIGEAASLYNNVNSIIGDVRTRVIKDHQKLAEGVYQTTYDGGKVIIVNYNDYSININGIEVMEQNYWVGGGS